MPLVKAECASAPYACTTLTSKPVRADLLGCVARHVLKSASINSINVRLASSAVTIRLFAHVLDRVVERALVTSLSLIASLSC